MSSYYEARARERIAGVLDEGVFHEILPPTERTLSPHLAALDLPVAFDDGIVIGAGQLFGARVFIAAQEGGFMGGAVGEIHGAKLVGLLKRAVRDRVAGVLLLLETGGVRLQEANAGLVAVSRIIRSILTARSHGVPVIAAVGGQYGCFGGMGIAAACCSALVMSELGRLGLSGPEVIETARGVEEFDARDRALVWRTTGGKHRYLMGDCTRLVDDRVDAFRVALSELLTAAPLPGEQTLKQSHAALAARLNRFNNSQDAADIWGALGWPDPERVPMLEADAFVHEAETRRVT